MTPSGGLDLVTVSTEPPWLQIRIISDVVFPGETGPKSMFKSVDGSHPPSKVEMLKFATGAVDALPSRTMDAELLSV